MKACQEYRVTVLSWPEMSASKLLILRGYRAPNSRPDLAALALELLVPPTVDIAFLQ